MASKEYMKKWREKRRGHIREYMKEYRKENKDRLRDLQKTWRAKNPEKQKAMSARKYAKNPELWARNVLKKTYGITLEQKQGLFESQNNRCAACKTKECRNTNGSWSLDHDHATRVIRGVLCNHCNMALGLLNDSIERCEQLIAYLNFKPDYSFEVL